jgi:putative glutathione S-transferase
MGLLINGQWHDQWYETKSTEGHFIREDAQFRNWVTTDGRPGPTGTGGFPAQSGRYHLYVSGACPWAHRTLIFRRLKNLDEAIEVSLVHPHMLQSGWEFRKEQEDSRFVDNLYGLPCLHRLYAKCDPGYSGRVTVPVLWDTVTEQIVSNESSEIIRMFNSSFNELTGNHVDHYPIKYQQEIDEWNELIYRSINNGVYRCGFATNQTAYAESFFELFETLNHIEERLTDNTYLCGSKATEADWRLFPTLIRFDPVYHGHFKCNLRRIEDYPQLFGYTRRLLHYPGILETVDLWQIQQHYYYSHETINPSRVVPLGPDMRAYANPTVDESAIPSESPQSINLFYDE